MTIRISLAAQRDAVQLEIDFRTREYSAFIREKHRLTSKYRDTPTSEIEREVDLEIRLAQMKAVLASLEQFEQGVIIGRREMKPLVRALVAALGALDPNVEGYYVGDKISKLIDRAKEALEND